MGQSKALRLPPLTIPRGTPEAPLMLGLVLLHERCTLVQRENRPERLFKTQFAGVGFCSGDEILKLCRRELVQRLQVSNHAVRVLRGGVLTNEVSAERHADRVHLHQIVAKPRLALICFLSRRCTEWATTDFQSIVPKTKFATGP